MCVEIDYKIPIRLGKNYKTAGGNFLTHWLTL